VTVATVAEIRAAFPALQRRHAGRPVAYFDGPGGTQVPASVAGAMQDYLLHHNANTHWRYPTSIETDQAIASARVGFADFLNASPAEIAFGANMTTLTFHLARGLARGWQPGDEILVTELDHHANIAPWTALGRERGLVIRTVPVLPAEGRLDPDALKHAFTPRTRLLAIGAASNAIGTINDIRAAADLAHAAGALVFVDAVHFAPHALIDVQAMGCDFLACSAYKFYGPHVGVLYGRAELLRTVDVPKLEPASDEIPERIETGTLNHEGIVGAAAAVAFLAGLSRGAMGRRAALEQTFAALHVRAEALVAKLWSGLAATVGVRLYGVPPEAPRTPTVAFTLDGHSSDDAAARLADAALFVSHGDFYAATLLHRLGLPATGLIRAGCACYTTEEEIDRLIAAVRRIANR
jgi:cysteine desulfurase family protein (TIGR01976 family)